MPCEAYCHSLSDPSILGAGAAAARRRADADVFALHMPARLFAADPVGPRDAALAATLASLDSVLAEPIADCLMRDRDGRPCIEVRSPVDLEAELRMPGGHIFHRDLSWPFAEEEEEVGIWGVETDEPAGHALWRRCQAGRWRQRDSRPQRGDGGSREGAPGDDRAAPDTRPRGVRRAGGWLPRGQARAQPARDRADPGPQRLSQRGARRCSPTAATSPARSATRRFERRRGAC